MDDSLKDNWIDPSWDFREVQTIELSGMHHQDLVGVFTLWDLTKCTNEEKLSMKAKWGRVTGWINKETILKYQLEIAPLMKHCYDNNIPDGIVTALYGCDIQR